MAQLHNVARYILKSIGPVTAMKLQKLVYYSQAWALVWDEKPLFKDRIEAWANGPVAPSLYSKHRGKFRLTKNDMPGDVRQLAAEERATIDGVLEYYGGHTSQWLSELTHREDPWRDAREGVSPGQRSQNEITPAAMAEYYGSL